MSNYFQFDDPKYQQEPDPQGDFEPIPEDWYNVQIVESEAKETKNHAETGNIMIAYQLKIIDGDYANRVIYYNINIKNANSQAEEIALRQNDALRCVTGQFRAKSSADFHGIPFRAYIVITPEKGEYGPKNEVKKVESESGKKPSECAKDYLTQSPPASPAPPPASKSERPTDPAYIHDNGDGTEQWFVNGEWDGGKHPAAPPEKPSAPPPPPEKSGDKAPWE